MVDWSLQGPEFVNCNCAYGCPCQFNALPTYGDCQAVSSMKIDEGHFGDVRLDGLSFVGRFLWPGAIHEGNGTVQVIIDERASEPQREALLQILSGEETEPGATIFNVFAATFTKMHDPIFAPIEIDIDVAARKAQINVDGVVESRGGPIVNETTGQEFRAVVQLPNGFEYTEAEYGRGWTKSLGDLAMQFDDSYGHFANLHLTGKGPVR